MGGKTKHVPRTKNNAKPSSSSRSAELLGASTPAFVGFSAHSELGLIAMVPGFAQTEQIPETFDASISAEVQMILRKLCKKDPITKNKALRELLDHINVAQLDEIKPLLPLWPKYYQNLAVDTENNVRELTQQLLQQLMCKCKRAIAPYLKQLVPLWLISQFDTYTPAAQVADKSFKQTFTTSQRQCEVCLYCHAEILEFCTRILTFHTAQTLNTGQSLTAQDSEQKYQRLLFGSLKSLSFFVQQINDADIPDSLLETFENLVTHKKFMSYSKNKLPDVKGAWFELIVHILQNSRIIIVLNNFKNILIATCVQNMDDPNVLIAPHAWHCLLLLQSQNEKWYESINIRKSLLSNLSSILRNIFANQSLTEICGNLLPFLSHLTPECLGELSLQDFDKKYFGDIIYALENTQFGAEKRSSHVIDAYFECLRYRFTKLQAKNYTNNNETNKEWALQLLKDFILAPIDQMLNANATEQQVLKFNEMGSGMGKHSVFFRNTADLIAFWIDKRNESCADDLYCQLLDEFWSHIFEIMKRSIEHNQHDSITFVRHMTDFMQDLHSCNPNLKKTRRVSFVQDETAQTSTSATTVSSITTHVRKNSVSSKLNLIVSSNNSLQLRQLVVQLVNLCLSRVQQVPQHSAAYIEEVRRLLRIFGDADFYAQLVDNKDLLTAVNSFVNLLNYISHVQPQINENDDRLDEQDSDKENDEQFALEQCDRLDSKATEDNVLEIIFDILQYVPRDERYNYITNDLLKIKQKHVLALIMYRLLSYPHCMEPEMRVLMQQPVAKDIIVQLAQDFVNYYDHKKLIIVEKCFFQDEAGNILIDSATVERIVEIVCTPLQQAESAVLESCASFIAQIISILCTPKFGLDKVKREVFIKLFRFTIDNASRQTVHEDTYLEVASAWQDALSTADISVDASLLLECTRIVHAKKIDIKTEDLKDLVAAVARFIICSTEELCKQGDAVKAEYAQKLDSIALTFFNAEELQTAQLLQLEQQCLFLNALSGMVTASDALQQPAVRPINCLPIFQRTLVNLRVLVQLLCGEENAPKNVHVMEQETEASGYLLTDVSDALYEQLLLCIRVATAGEILLQVGTELTEVHVPYIFEMTEYVRRLITTRADVAHALKKLMLQQLVAKPNCILSLALLYMLDSIEYLVYEENSTVIFEEELAEHFIAHQANAAYVHSLQYLLRSLKPRALSLNVHIMRQEPKELWIRASVFRCYVHNLSSGESMNKEDRAVIMSALEFLTQISEQNREQKSQLLCSNINLVNSSYEAVIDTIEYINLLTVCLQYAPYQLTFKHWDSIRVGLGAWTLSISKSIEHHTEPKIAFFIVSVYKLFATLITFLNEERQKSSTLLLKNVMEEWDIVFANDVNYSLFRSFYRLCEQQDIYTTHEKWSPLVWNTVLAEITPAVELINYSTVYEVYQRKPNEYEKMLERMLENLRDKNNTTVLISAYILRQLMPFHVKADQESCSKALDSQSMDEYTANPQHFLLRLEPYLKQFEMFIYKYLKEFSFKLAEILFFETINTSEAFRYLLIWDLIIDACSTAPIFLRSIYINWLQERNYEDKFLHFLFRAMPADILTNHESKHIATNDLFNTYTWNDIKTMSLRIDNYACHLYAKVLRKLPAAVRKWWNLTSSRQKTFVDKLTTNYVSALICQEELRSIMNKKEKHENMQVSVHMSTREVNAVYCIDDVRMELFISLAQNYPLGSMKVDCGKQIGGRGNARNIGMQLTIFLTHQNGTIYDGLLIWRDNLDKKFEGVEECFICYTVIHQDTCQLPKLTCKTCRKKFHGPCLYKWFTTSSKSTCPMCRNVF